MSEEPLLECEAELADRYISLHPAQMLEAVSEPLRGLFFLNETLQRLQGPQGWPFLLSQAPVSPRCLLSSEGCFSTNTRAKTT